MMHMADYFFQVGLGDNSLQESRILPNSENEHEIKETSNAASSVHPINYSYLSKVTFRYPIQDHEDFIFPNLSMFCFPNDLKFIIDEKSAPAPAFHYFVTTNDLGVKFYAVAIIIYETLNEDQMKDFNETLEKWRCENIDENDIEFTKHLQSQLCMFKKQLEKFQESMDIDQDSPDSDLESAIASTKDQIAVFQDLLYPLKLNLILDGTNVYIPRCIGLLSRLPCLSFLKDWLGELLYVKSKGICDISIEDSICGLIHEIPLPPPGKLEIIIPIGRIKLYFSLPQVNTFPHLNNVSIYPLFQTLSVNQIILFMELLLMERKIVVVSSNLSMLTTITEIMLSLIFPFYWHHIYIPVLPAKLLRYLQAPMPFLVGIHLEYFSKEIQKEMCPPDVVVINIDKDTIEYNLAPISLPSREKRKLMLRLTQYVEKTLRGIKRCGKSSSNSIFHNGIHFPSSPFLETRRKINATEKPRPANSANSLISSEINLSAFSIDKKFADDETNSLISMNEIAFELPSANKTSSPLSIETPKLKEIKTITRKRSTSIFERIYKSRSFDRVASSDNLSCPKEIVIQIYGHSFITTNEDIIFEPFENSELIGDNYKLIKDIPIRDHRNCRLCQEKIIPREGYHKCSNCGINIHKECIPFIDILPCSKYFKEEDVRDLFLNIFTSILRNYQTFLKSTNEKIIEKDESLTLSDMFCTNDFLLDLDLESRIFMESFCDSQSFIEFIHNRHIHKSGRMHYESIFLDDAIKSKLNRSKFQIQKYATPFLSDDSFDVCMSVMIVSSNSKKEENQIFLTDKKFFNLKHEMFPIARTIRPLFLECDTVLLEFYVKSIIMKNALNIKLKNYDRWIKYSFKGNGDKNYSGMTIEEKRKFIQEQFQEINSAIYFYGSIYLSFLSLAEIKNSILSLFSQHLTMRRILEDAVILEEKDDIQLQFLYGQLFQLISIYEDYQQSITHTKNNGSEYELDGLSVIKSIKTSESIVTINSVLSKKSNVNPQNEQDEVSASLKISVYQNKIQNVANNQS